MSGFFEESKKIYDKLADLKSKEIYSARLQYSMTNDYKYISEMVMKSGKGFEDGSYDRKKSIAILQKLEKYLRNKKVIIYGAGYVGKEIESLLEGIEIYGFCDKNWNELPKEINGISVFSVEESAEVEGAIFLIGSWRYRENMRETLYSYGVKENQIIDFPSNCMINVSNEQYFEKDLIKLTDDEVFVDCGSYHFETSMEFIKQVEGKYKKIYAFEPDSENYKNILDRIKKNEMQKVYCKCAGVWRKSGTLSFRSNMDSSMIAEDGMETIDVISLDEELLDETVSFIKMDIEGAELEALHGAKEVIAKCKPKLAISIYHRPEDIIELPKYILDLNPEYRLFLRHYSNSDVETVLYAI